MLKFSPANAKTSNLVKVPAIATYLGGKRKVYSLDMTSGKTCPGAEECHGWADVDPQTGKATIKDGPHCRFRCFSASQEVQYPTLRALRAHNTAEIKACGRSAAKITRLIMASLPHDAGVVRLHVGGDFFSLAYMSGMVGVAAARPDVLFYCYTKSLHFLERVVQDTPTADLGRGIILPNFLVTASYGGKYDALIDLLGVRRATVVFAEHAPENGPPIDHDDSHAATPGGSFALLLHGTQPAGSDAGKALSLLRGKGSYSRK